MMNMWHYLPLPSFFPTLYIHNAVFGVTLPTLPLAAIRDVFLGEPADDRYGPWKYSEPECERLTSISLRRR